MKTRLTAHIYRNSRRVAALLLAVNLFSVPASAQSAPQAASIEMVYTVSGLAVDERAETSALARDNALAVARRQAFARLVRRLVLTADQQKLPVPSDEQLLDLIAGMEVGGEKTSNQRYIARLTIRFAPDQARALLRNAGVRFSETSAPPVLLLPVSESATGRLLWETPNPWREAIAAALAAQGEGAELLLPLYLPQADFQNTSAITADQAIAADPDRINAFVGLYGAKEVIIAHAIMSAAQVSVNWRRLGGAQETPRLERIDIQPGEAPENVLARFAQAIIHQTQESWKLETALDFKENTAIPVSVPVQSLADWLAVYKLLESAPMIRRIDIRALSVTQAQIMLHYLGTVERLQAALAKHQLLLTPLDDGWTLRKQL